MNKQDKLLRIADILDRNIYTDDEYIDRHLSRNCKNLHSLIIKTNNFTKNNLRNIGNKRWEVVKEVYYNSHEYRELMQLLGDEDD